jgi:twinkle protein
VTDSFRPIPDHFERLGSRNISEESCVKYNIWLDGEGNHVYPYFDKHGHHSGNKVRVPNNKYFFAEGTLTKTGLFGQQAFPPGGKFITVVEGELDAASVYDLFGNKYPCVSVRGAGSVEKDLAENFEYVNSFDTIVVCFDKDEAHYRNDGTAFYPGQEAALKAAQMFPLGKVKILTLQEGKDANEYLMNNWGAKFRDEWWKAPEYTPEGIKLAKDLWKEVSHQKNYETVLYPWEGLNERTFGIRLSELVTVTADTGVGKTQLLREVIYNILPQSGRGIGLCFLEETNGDTLLGLMSVHCNRPLHLPNVRAEITDEELKKIFDAVCSDERLVIWDHFGSNEVEGVLQKVRHMHALGCKYIILDHLSIVVSDQSGDERKQLDEISTKLKTLCMELNVAIICVIHQNRKGEIRGTAGVEQLSNIVIKLYRDKEADDAFRRNVTKVTVQKNRFCGRTGPATYLHYDEGTGRLSELSQDQVKVYESGGTASIETKDQW